MITARCALRIVSIGVWILAASVSFGQDFPNKVIRIVTAPAGGSSDFAARQLAQGIAGPLGQSVVVDNRGSFIIAAEVTAKSPADGYTLMVNGGALWIGPLLRKMSYDAVADFAPITLIDREVNVLVVHPSVPAKTVKELVALAKARPGEINYGGSSIGSPSHLAAELFRSMAGVNITGVPYKGNAATITALISGEVQMAICDQGSVLPNVKSGKLRALAVTSAEPSAVLPNLPTVAATLPGYESVGMTGIAAPAKTPAAVMSRLNREIVRFLNRPDVKERFLSTGVEIVADAPEEYAAIIEQDIGRMSKIIKDANIKAD